MKCPRCNGEGSVPYHIADDLFDETNCPLCGGSGEVMTEQEYLQTCNTEQLAEVLNKMTLSCYICGQDGVREDTRHCVFGKCTGKEDIKEWLKRPHREE